MNENIYHIKIFNNSIQQPEKKNEINSRHQNKQFRLTKKVGNKIVETILLEYLGDGEGFEFEDIPHSNIHKRTIYKDPEYKALDLSQEKIKHENKQSTNGEILSSKPKLDTLKENETEEDINQSEIKVVKDESIKNISKPQKGAEIFNQLTKNKIDKNKKN